MPLAAMSPTPICGPCGRSVGKCSTGFDTAPRVTPPQVPNRISEGSPRRSNDRQCNLPMCQREFRHAVGLIRYLDNNVRAIQPHRGILVENAMWSDNETSVDFLGFQHLVAGLNSIVHNDALLPATIGVFGDWGSGKSSLLRIGAEELKKNEDMLVLTFNGWLFEGYGDAKTALMGNILDALAEDKTLAAEAKGLAVKLLKRVNWWRVAGTVGKAGIGLALGGPAGLGLAVCGDLANVSKDLLKKGAELKEEDLTHYFRESTDHEERKSIREFRDDFSRLLSHTKRRRLVVIIDDLDRCLPETIIETLEAIKLFLFVPHTAFIIGADERLVQYAVRRRFPELPGERANVGRDYLEKLIQFPIRVPPLGRTETERYVSLLLMSQAKIDGKQFESLRQATVLCDPKTLHSMRFGKDVAQNVIDTTDTDIAGRLSLAERIAPVLAAETLGNPRQCKRFLNMLSIRMGMAEARGVKDLQVRILAKLMLLEYYRPESFRHLAGAQAEEEGKPVVLASAEKLYREKPSGSKTMKAKQEKAASQGDDDNTPEGEFPLWLLDPWVQKWVQMEPALAGEDLRPYFYFSRDILGPMGAVAQRMSPPAQDVFTRLISPSAAEKGTGFKRAATLTPSDASAVFEGLAQQVREADDHSDESATLPTIVDWVKARPELTGQLASLLSNIPDEKLPVALPMTLVPLVKSEHGAPLAKLFHQWSNSKLDKLKQSTAAAAKRTQ
ncbi:hypothetical protein B7486_07680 [cyanobacterium TDX16]|nr:hypothetical protein B7486_07680 [cyanobacterium TDX16]